MSEENAHPHFDTTNAVHVVVNGIVENYVVLKRRLQDAGAVFTSETDAEVIAHLVAHHCAEPNLARRTLFVVHRTLGRCVQAIPATGKLLNFHRHLKVVLDNLFQRRCRARLHPQ